VRCIFPDPLQMPHAETPLKKKTMFFNTASKNTVNYRSFSRGGVDTGWVGGRGRSVYNFRLPPKASGKDTGWPLAGARPPICGTSLASQLVAGAPVAGIIATRPAQDSGLSGLSRQGNDCETRSSWRFHRAPRDGSRCLTLLSEPSRKTVVEARKRLPRTWPPHNKTPSC